MKLRPEDPKKVAATPLDRHSDLHGQTLPAQVSKLLQTAAELRREADPAWAAHVVEANEQLILSSLHAEKMIETAVHQLDQLTRAGQRDALTDTPNRALMLDRLELALATAKRHRSHVAVLFVDLDGFKQINDTNGHAAGDEVLKTAARVLQSVLRRSDTVSRHGGDEFLVLLPEISQASAAARIATKMLAALAKVRVGADLICLTASIGIAVYPGDGEDPSTLIHCADDAMYRTKRLGPGNYAFHRSVLEQPPAVATTAAEPPRPPSSNPSDHVHAQVANDLRGSISRQQSLALLSQVQTDDPVLRLLIDREIARLQDSTTEPDNCK
jgi:diguanylate cyclase (GGDEF)-like protein